MGSFEEDVYLGIFGKTEDELMHFGKAHDENPPGRGSGRFAYGSGDRPNQHDDSLYGRMMAYKAGNPNRTNAQIAADFGFYKKDAKGNYILDKQGNKVGDEKVISNLKPKREDVFTSELQRKVNDYKREHPDKTLSEVAAEFEFYKMDDYGNYILDQNGNKVGNGKALTAAISIAEVTKRLDIQQQVKSLWAETDADGNNLYSKTEIGEMLGITEGAVRKMLTTDYVSSNKKMQVAELLKEAVKDGSMYDVGKGAALELKITDSSLDVVKEMLKQEGYVIKEVYQSYDEIGNGRGLHYPVLCPPGTDPASVKYNLSDVKSIRNYISDEPGNVLSEAGREPYRAIDMDRIDVKFKEFDGDQRDGLIELRGKLNPDGTVSPACEDLSLGEARYAQIRIAVNDKDGNPNYYIKGMAVYNPDLPEGVDIRINSNKSVEKGVEGSLKKLTKDENGNVVDDLPFGATVYQTHYIGQDGKEHLSSVNIVGYGPGDGHKEGNWGEWSRNLSAQFLSKQPIELIKQQLNLDVLSRKREFDEIMSLNNEVIRKKFLDDFAENCDSAAVDLKAHAIPGQMTHVLLPMPELKDNEIYAPNYPNGTTVMLVRHPHAGPFESPILRVNNNIKSYEVPEDAADAVGINTTNAQRLSGADFDGDTVSVIPIAKPGGDRTVKVRGYNDDAFSIKVAQLMKGFDPTEAFEDKIAAANERKTITTKHKNMMMGIASNLITDMYARGCQNAEEMARAVKFSMVIIDSEKHYLDYKKAEKVLNIQELKDKYQLTFNPDTGEEKVGGASSLISRSKSERRVPKLSEQKGKIDPETGEREVKYVSDEKMYYPKREQVKIPAPEGYMVPVIDKKTGQAVLNKDGTQKMRKSKWLLDDKGEPLLQMHQVKDRMGNLVYKADGTPKMAYDMQQVYNKDGTPKIERRNSKVPWMSIAKDASELLSNGENSSPVELAYRDYANTMKAMANQARKEEAAVKYSPIDPVAKKEYAEEVKSIKNKLAESETWAYKDRQARRLATAMAKTTLDGMVDPSQKDKQKVNAQTLKIARQRVGLTKRERLTFTDREWEAVQKHAVGSSDLEKFLQKADPDDYKARAMPKTSGISPATFNYISSLIAANPNVSLQKLSESSGYSVPTLRKVKNGSINVE